MKLLLSILIITQLINNSLFSQIDTNNKNNTFLGKDKDIIKDNLLSYDSVKISSYFPFRGETFLQFVNKDSKGNYIFVGYTKGDIDNYKSKILDTNSGREDIFIYKYDKDFKIIWGTMYGGDSIDIASDIEIDINDNIWICGETISSDLPRTRTIPFQTLKGSNGFICCVSPDGELLFSETFGSNYYDSFNCLATDKDGVCYVGGRSFLTGFTVTDDALFPKNSSGGYHSVIVKVFPDGNIYSSYLFQNKIGDYTIEGIDVDDEGSIIVGGFTNDSLHKTFNANLKDKYTNGGEYEIYLQKYDKNFNLIWDNLFGGLRIDKLSALQLGDDNNIYVLISTQSNNLPVKNSLNLSYKSNFDCYLMKISQDANFIWGTYIGSTGEEAYGEKGDFNRVRADLFYNNYLIGLNFVTAGENLPFTYNSYQKKINPNYGGKSYDTYSIILNSKGELEYSTLFGCKTDNTITNFTDLSYSIWFDESELIINGATFGTMNLTENALYKNIYRTYLSGFIFVLNNPFARENKLNPTIASESMNYCDGKAEYCIFDDNIPYGFRKIKIIENVNCDVQQSIINDSLNLSINKINNELDAYYKIEILNYVGKKLIIEDSILTFTPNLLAINQNLIYDFGKLSIFENQQCKNINISNDSKMDISISEGYFKNYDLFSFPLNQLPIKIPAQSSKDFTICVSQEKMNYSIINDTLVLISNCFTKELPVKAEYYIPNLSSDTKCDLSLEIIPDSSNFFNYQSIVSHNNELLIESNSKAIQSIELFDLYSARINEVDITNKSNLIQIDFNNLANGTYFIYIKEEKSINIIQLCLIR